MSFEHFSTITVGGEHRLDLTNLAWVARGVTVALDRSVFPAMVASHQFFLEKVKSRIPVYGLNTQFGDQVTLLDEHLDDYETDRYETSIRNRQINLIRSHACGLGDVVPDEIARGAMLLRALCLSQGYAGVRPQVVESYIEFLNRGIVPACYRFGSIGASGDLIPLELRMRSASGGHRAGGNLAPRPACECGPPQKEPGAAHEHHCGSD